MADGVHTAQRRFGKVRTHAVTSEDLRISIRRALEKGTPLFVTYANAHNICVAESSAEYRAALSTFDIVFPEGVGLARAAKMLRYQGYSAYHSTDFWPTLFDDIRATGSPVFLLGASRETLRKVDSAFDSMGITIAGMADGYSGVENTETLLPAIKNSGAKVLLVGMGVPKQEIWLANNRTSLEPKVALCVGNYFEFVSGNVRRAPVFMRQLGLEWLHRMFVEPKRLWRRYILGIPRFWSIIRNQRKGNADRADR